MDHGQNPNQMNHFFITQISSPIAIIAIAALTS
jgi:hypothetical protein